MRNALLVLAALLAITTPTEQAQAFELEAPSALPVSATTTPLTDIDGQPISLDDYKGQVLVVNFWATWCGPCRREMPSVGRLQTLFEDQNLKILAVAVDRASPDKLNQFMAETEASHLTILRDTAMASMKGFELRGLPATIVLDTDGQQVARHDGFDEWDRPEIIEALQSLLPDA